MQTDENEIREALHEYETAMRKADAAGVVAHYAADVVAFTLAPPLRQAAIEMTDPARLQAWFDGHGGGPMDYEITELAVTTDGSDVAFASSLNRMGSPDAGFTLWFRASYGLRRADRAWLIAHEHTSTPFYMDGTMRAALDLTPTAGGR
ncbi:MAG: hypothetical protein QOG01_1363 [Pseudonocardiales bacterium]|jgi:ketosteroid isomerase-like protein|nr:hypothetical protein [Pseudonocardiales bacterium]